MVHLSPTYLKCLRDALDRVIFGPPAQLIQDRNPTQMLHIGHHIAVRGSKTYPFQHNNKEDYGYNLLCEDEKEQLLTFKAPWRINQYIAGRIAAKFTIVDLLQEWGAEMMPKSISILKTDFGTSKVHIRGFSNPDISAAVSLTHKSNIVVAAASLSSNVGIDLEDLSVCHPGLLDRCMSDEELRFLDDFIDFIQRSCLISDPDMLITALWSAKEAAFKSLCRGLCISPLMVELFPEGTHIRARINPLHPRNEAIVYLIRIRAYLLALALSVAPH